MTADINIRLLVPVLILALFLSACAPPTPPEPTIDIGAIQTSAAGTAFAVGAKTDQAKTPTLTPTITLTPSVTYTVSPNHTPTNTPRPTVAPTAEIIPTATTAAYPPGVTAVCKDGTYSRAQHRRGACSGHGGVAFWVQVVPP